MEFFREVYADGEPDLLETPGAIKIQFSSSFYHPDKKTVMRQPAVAIVLTPDAFNKLMNTVAEFMKGKQEQALAQARAAAEAQSAPNQDAAESQIAASAGAAVRNDDDAPIAIGVNTPPA
jgi:hypothetical protein